MKKEFKVTLTKPWFIVATCFVAILMILTTIFGYLAFRPKKKGDNNKDEKTSVGISQIGPGGGGRYYHAKINPKDNMNIITSNDMGGTYVTLDGGKSWIVPNPNPGSNYVFDPNDKNVVWGFGNYLFRSSDKGQTWQWVMPTASQVQYVRSGISEGGGTTVFASGTNVTGGIPCLVVDPRDSNHVTFIARPKGNDIDMYESTDGKTFIKKYSGTWDYTASADTANTLVGGLGRGYVAYSEMLYIQNKIYVVSSEGILLLDEDKFTRILSVASASGDYVISGESAFAYLIVDNGSGKPCVKKFNIATGAQVAVVLDDENNRVDRVAAANENVIYVARNRAVSKTTDGGQNWKYVLADSVNKLSNITNHNWVEYRDTNVTYPTSGWNGLHQWLSVSKGDANACVVETASNAYVTFNGGDTWADMASTSTDNGTANGKYTTTNLDNSGPCDFAVDPWDKEHQYLGYIDIGLWESFDGGKSWCMVREQDLKQYNTCYAVVFDPTKRGRVYTAWSTRHDMQVGSYQSAALRGMRDFIKNPFTGEAPNGIADWTGAIQVRDVNPATGEVSWYGKQTNPVTANHTANGLPFWSSMTSVVVDESNGDVYCTAYGWGVYKSTDHGKHWTAFNAGTEGEFSQAANDNAHPLTYADKQAGYQENPRDGVTQYKTKPVWRLQWAGGKLYALWWANGSATSNWDLIDYAPNDGAIYVMNAAKTGWDKFTAFPIDIPEVTSAKTASSSGYGLVDHVNVPTGIVANKNGTLFLSTKCHSIGGSERYNYGGLWMYKNGEWRNIYSSTVTVYDVKLSATNENVIYICSMNGSVISCSTDGENTKDESWNVISKIPAGDAFRLATPITDPKHLYVLTRGAGAWLVNITPQ